MGGHPFSKKGLVCPYCKSDMLSRYETRQCKSGRTMRRYRCGNCYHTFKTFEIYCPEGTDKNKLSYANIPNDILNYKALEEEYEL